jgi:2-phospho-L-lactate guanylyltransferase
MDPRTVVLVPFRDPSSAKTRLSPGFDPEARRSLASAMLVDVVAALQGAGLERIVVLAGGPMAAAAARALGVDALPDPPGGGLDRALAAAARRVRADASLVVPADLPTLRPDDVTAVLDTDGEVVVAPTADGGTGALLRRPAWVMPTSYGGRSAARHLLAARRAGLSATRVDVAGFALDVDVSDDVESALATSDLGPATANVLRSLGLRTV